MISTGAVLHKNEVLVVTSKFTSNSATLEEGDSLKLQEDSVIFGVNDGRYKSIFFEVVEKNTSYMLDLDAVMKNCSFQYAEPDNKEETIVKKAIKRFTKEEFSERLGEYNGNR